MLARIEIPGKLPTMNEYNGAQRANRVHGARMKRKTQDSIIDYCWGIPSFARIKHVYVGFVWVRADRRSDKDNVATGKKFVLDALQEAGILSNDSWKLCTPYDLGYMVNPRNPRTIVYISTDLDEIMQEIGGLGAPRLETGRLDGGRSNKTTGTGRNHEGKRYSK